MLHGVDRLTRVWVRVTGRRVELPAGHWLDGPSGDAPEIGDAWLTRLAAGRPMRAGGGLLPSMSALDGPGADRPSVRVVFPLPAGRLVVLLRPELTADGGLVLSSGPGRWGDDAAYLVVHPAGRRRGWARPVPLRERFHVYVDDEGELRTDHELRLGAMQVLQLHYRLAPPP